MPYDILPMTDMSDTETGCCPRFDPAAWDELEVHFEDKLFVRAVTHAIFHMPIDMGRVFARVHAHLEAAGAYEPNEFVVLSRDLGAWTSEHYYAAGKAVPDEEMVRLSGTFLTRVFDGPYSRIQNWCEEMKALATERGNPDGSIYFYYTTCPKCAKHYGHNYVVGFAEI